MCKPEAFLLTLSGDPKNIQESGSLNHSFITLSIKGAPAEAYIIHGNKH